MAGHGTPADQPRTPHTKTHTHAPHAGEIGGRFASVGGQPRGHEGSHEGRQPDRDRVEEEAHYAEHDCLAECEAEEQNVIVRHLPRKAATARDRAQEHEGQHTAGDQRRIQRVRRLLAAFGG